MHLMDVRAKLGLLLIAGVFAVAVTAQGAHTKVELVLAVETAKPGDTVLAAVHLRMDQGWHTYWKNPGASGQETKIEWELPSGVTAGPIQWPAPEKMAEEDLTTYV